MKHSDKQYSWWKVFFSRCLKDAGGSFHLEWDYDVAGPYPKWISLQGLLSLLVNCDKPKK